MCAPCECTGTIKYIHVACLKEWLKEKKSIKCELCSSLYKNKWKVWAFKNKVIKSDEVYLTTLQKLVIFFKALVLIYIQVIFLYSMLMYNGRTIGVRNGHHSQFEKGYILLICGGLVMVPIACFVAFYGTFGFREKVEEQVRELFPHSNN